MGHVESVEKAMANAEILKQCISKRQHKFNMGVLTPLSGVRNGTDECALFEFQLLLSKDQKMVAEVIYIINNDPTILEMFKNVKYWLLEFKCPDIIIILNNIYELEKEDHDIIVNLHLYRSLTEKTPILKSPRKKFSDKGYDFNSYSKYNI